MPNFTKTEDELTTHFDKWLYVLKNLHKFQNHPKVLKEKIFNKLFQIAEISNFTKEEIEEYERSLKSYRDLNNTIDSKYRKGIEKGIEKNKIEVAIVMMKNGESDEKISQYTLLPIAEIESLRKEILNL
jgi:predicted transposase/invertase (TIGR01784 family)